MTLSAVRNSPREKTDRQCHVNILQRQWLFSIDEEMLPSQVCYLNLEHDDSRRLTDNARRALRLSFSLAAVTKKRVSGSRQWN